jgi:Domain of unknown function (DUF6259)
MLCCRLRSFIRFSFRKTCENSLNKTRHKTASSVTSRLFRISFAIAGPASVSLLLSMTCLNAQTSAAMKSGQASPAYDSDRQMPVSGKSVVIENDDVRLAFDSKSGAMVEFVSRRTGWRVQAKPELAGSFRIFAPAKDRSYSPILGARNKVASITKSADGKSLTLVWSGLESEYYGKLDITLTGKVTLKGPDAAFDMEVRNNSKNEISSVDWPIIGDLQKPDDAKEIRRITWAYGTGMTVPVWPQFENERGYYGTNYPTQMGDGRYNVLLAGGQGLYMGNHDVTYKEITKWTLELKPGYDNSFNAHVPQMNSIDGHPVRIVASMEHFPFVPPGGTSALATIVLSPFQGGWQHGADVYRRWHATWFRRPIEPAWAVGVHSWQQIQINSAEDDLRTPYRDLPKRAAEAAKNGISAIQLVGWNDGGQDRGNPYHNPDPRLGTYDELKSAIEQIEKMGVHVILFNKYTWADTSNADYDKELDKLMAHDPNGRTYIYHGYEYQTPEQLADLNTRRLASACTPDPGWIKLSDDEFQKSINLGASGILYDEVQHHGGANYCFTHNAKGDLIAQSLWAGDSELGASFRDLIRKSVGEDHFLMAGEAAYDLETRYYSETYYRIAPGHIPLDRYDDPGLNIMIALTGFDDREMANQALLYRYVLSYEPFNFKGNLSDYPPTLEYGKKIDALRKQYAEYLWGGEFRDAQDATVTVDGVSYLNFSVFRSTSGKRAAVIVNTTGKPLAAEVKFDGGSKGTLAWVSPDDPALHSSNSTVQVPVRGAVVLMER